MTDPIEGRMHPLTSDPSFTRRNREWFTQRYDFASAGVYFPHQPVYGFSRWEEHIQDYFRSYHLLRALERIRFSSFLDVGCAEGYFVNLVRSLFEVDAVGVDIAPSGVRRARELYRIPGVAADALRLPFRDRSFDVVLSSETLEHVADPQAVIAELVRVARRYVVLSTPAARSQAELDEHFRRVDANVIFSHFHYFTEAQLRAWLPPGTLVLGAGHRSMERVFRWFSSGHDQAAAIRDLLGFLERSCPDMDQATLSAYRSHAATLTGQPPWWQRLLGPRALALALLCDYRLSQRAPDETLAFVTVSPCHGTAFDAPPRQRRRGLLRYLLFDNRVDPLRLSAEAAEAAR
jgi:SAM-dependent methyltransferase